MCAQIDEDTDRDRYMSPLEAKQYGIIDSVIGGDEAGFKARPPIYLYHSSNMQLNCEAALVTGGPALTQAAVLCFPL